MQLALKHRTFLGVQNIIGWVNMPWFTPLFLFWFRIVWGYRCHELKEVRKKFADLIEKTNDSPLIIASNHLTMVDSMILGLFLSHPGRICLNFRLLPWNVPELSNFGKNPAVRLMCYLGKCVYVERKGTVASRSLTTAKLHYLLERRQILCIFPEGGRSRTGRVDKEGAVYGVGALLNHVPNCKVLTTYLRGRSQLEHSFFPKRGETFHISMDLLTPETSHQGKRAARDLTHQVMDHLINLENQHFESTSQLENLAQ